MPGFWIAASLLLAVAYALFVPILRGRALGQSVSRQKLNLELHRQRREEILAETGGDANSLQAELDRELLSDLAAEDPKPNPSSHAGKGALVATLVAAPVLACLLYLQLGRPDLSDFSAEPQANAETQGMAAELEAMTDRLAKRLEHEPNDIKGWLLLGRSYGQIEQYDQAVGAYERAMALDPKNLDIKGFYAEALAQANGGTFKGRPAELADEILAADPQHRNGLWVAAAAAAEQGETGKALAFLEKLKAQFPSDSEDNKFVGGVIAKLKGLPAEAESQVATAEPQPARPHKSIRVKVSLSPSLKSKAAPSDTLFVFARAASGPPMPLAIAKRQVSELPLEVNLDDTMGMVQGMNIAAFEELVIGARISKTGKALPAPGDLQGLSPPTKAESGKIYSVVIGEEVR